MEITVKTAHYIKRRVVLQDRVDRVLCWAVGGLGTLSQQAKDAANDALYNNKDAIYNHGGYVLIKKNVFDAIYPLCSKEDRRALRASLKESRELFNYSSEVVLRAEPSMKVGTLKLLLKAKPWIPKKNFLLVKEEGTSPLDDNSTLNDCGIKEEDSVLLACMGGSFPLTVFDDDIESQNEFVIPISSCFETVGDLKKRIHQKTGKDPDDQRIIYQVSSIQPKLIKHPCMLYELPNVNNSDSVPLVAHGITRLYLRNMPESAKYIEMHTESSFTKHWSESSFTKHWR